MASKVLSTGIPHSVLPENYVRPESERPKLSEVTNCENVPIVDLGCTDKNRVIQQIGDACRNFGFFQVINHGISVESTERMLEMANEFFDLPLEEKMKYYSDDPSKTLRLSTSFNVKKETVHNWRDYLRLHCYPLDKFVHEWPSHPSSFKVQSKSDPISTSPTDTHGSKISTGTHHRYSKLFAWLMNSVNLERSFVVLPLKRSIKEVVLMPDSCSCDRDVVSKYCREARQLGFRLLEAISESLGLEGDYIEKVLGEQGQHMAVNFYPPCPEPELTYGLPGHTDPNALTILLQDQQVAGLQVLKDGKWLAVNPHPNAFVVNIGDQLQALSNGMYRSVWHRAVVNSTKSRVSVASFLCPCDNAIIGPAKALTDRSATVYRSFTYDEYYKKFWSRTLDQEHCLELFKN
ncbi:hypothetical protein HHK36_027365 [Tetracentron sinense]|uniref:Fe2OG dioxygenase domain-containing protein n=1 Tax=Tetracentron sinense TaxID=13715 RepID=A0A835D1I3_TETSI|nr:hypothetical protein HHK36_027365 [Tetracentron sinense]